MQNWKKIPGGKKQDKKWWEKQDIGKNKVKTLIDLKKITIHVLQIFYMFVSNNLTPN